LCCHIHHIENRVPITLFRHPDEAGKAVGTAALVGLSLRNCHIVDTHAVALQPSHRHRLLLFPPLGAVDPAAVINATQLGEHYRASQLAEQFEILVLDATWRKARKMYYLSPDLHNLPRLGVDTSQLGNYTIRQAEKPGQLSTLEAIAAALGEIEGNPVKYQPLLDLQSAMVQQQLASMPEHVRKRYRTIER
jgi:DTW domain-containing protein YfiP